jgi:hypothetical protein
LIAAGWDIDNLFEAVVSRMRALRQLAMREANGRNQTGGQAVFPRL